jgi:peptide chain release factor 1
LDSQVVKLAEETLGRYDALTQELSDPNIFDDQRRYAGVAKEHARMRRGAELSRDLLTAIEAGSAGVDPPGREHGGARVLYG